MKAVRVPSAAPVVKGLTLHSGHVEEVAGKEATAVTRFFGKSADLRNLWNSETGLLALLITLKVVGIPLAAPIIKHLALLGDGVVVIALDVSPARTLFYGKQTRTFTS